MSWRDELISKDNLKRAYFRGVPFYIKKSEVEVGRRTRLYEYKDDTNTRVADLGYKADVFNIEGYLIQSIDNQFSYFEERDNLIKAFKKLDIDAKGEVAELIHPYYGRRNVQIIEPARFTETSDEGGICRFTVSLAEQGKAAIKGGTPDLISEMDSIIDKINNVLSDNFLDQFNSGALAIQNTLDTANAQLVQVQSNIYSVRNTVSSTIASATGLVAAAINTLAAVVNSPCDLYSTMQSGVNAMQSLVGMAGDVITGGVVGGCSGVVRGEVVTINGEDIPSDIGTSVVGNYIKSSDTSTITVDEGENTGAMNDIFAAQNAMAMAAVSVRVDYESRTDLIDVREAVTTAIDTMVLDSSDPVVIQQLEILRTEYARISLEQIFNFGNEINYEISPGVQSTLVVAYDQYNDLDREEEITRRNKIKHPGFIMADTLSVLDE